MSGRQNTLTVCETHCINKWKKLSDEWISIFNKNSPDRRATGFYAYCGGGVMDLTLERLSSPKGESYGDGLIQLLREMGTIGIFQSAVTGIFFKSNDTLYFQDTKDIEHHLVMNHLSSKCNFFTAIRTGPEFRIMVFDPINPGRLTMDELELVSGILLREDMNTVTVMYDANETVKSIHPSADARSIELTLHRVFSQKPPRKSVSAFMAIFAGMIYKGIVTEEKPAMIKEYKPVVDYEISSIPGNVWSDFAKNLLPLIEPDTKFNVVFQNSRYHLVKHDPNEVAPKLGNSFFDNGMLVENWPGVEFASETQNDDFQEFLSKLIAGDPV